MQKSEELESSQAMTQQDRAEYWRNIISEQRSSGLTVKAWCLEHHHSTSNFYQWKHRLKEQDNQTVPSFIHVGILENDAYIDITVQGDVVVHVPSHFDEDCLRRLMSVLRSS